MAHMTVIVLAYHANFMSFRLYRYMVLQKVFNRIALIFTDY